MKREKSNNSLHAGTAIWLALLITLLGCSRSPTEHIVLAKVGNAELTMQKIHEDLGNQFLGSDSLRIVHDYIRRWVEQELLYQGAIRSGYEEDKTIRAEMDRMKRQLLSNIYLENSVRDQMKNSDDEVLNYYQNNISNFLTDENCFVVQHIVVKTAKDARLVMEELKKRNSLEEIQADDVEISTGILSKIRNPIPESKIPDALLREIRKLKVGETANPISYDSEFSIIKLLDSIKKDDPVPLQYVRTRVESMLSVQKKREGYERLVEELKEETDVYIYTRPAPAGVPSEEAEKSAEGDSVVAAKEEEQ